MNNKHNKLFQRLQKSKFRSKFHLGPKEQNICKTKGIPKIQQDAFEIITKRVSKLENVIDGKQTPMRGHPVFIAQHATATCCRGCIWKWHKIKKGKLLNQ